MLKSCFFSRAIAISTLVLMSTLVACGQNASYHQNLEKDLSAFGEVTKLSQSLKSVDDLNVGFAKGAKSGTKSIVKVSHESFDEALQVNSHRAGDNGWDVNIHSPLSDVKLKDGDLVVAIFFVRCLSSDNTGMGQIKVYLESSPTWNSYGSWEGEFDQSWKRVSIIGKITDEIKDNKLQLSVHCAGRRQELQFGAPTLHLIPNSNNEVDMRALKRVVSSPLEYEGMEPDAQWRKDAAARIEEIRKQNLTLQFINRNGKPVKKAQVSLELKEHEFGFGTFIGGLDSKDNMWWTEEQTDQYLMKTREYFNKYTVPMYWASWSKWGWPEKQFEEKYKLPLGWATRTGRSIRGHVTVWPSYNYMPFFKPLEATPNKIDEKIKEHLQFVFSHPMVHGRMNDWDIVNEVYANHEIPDLFPQKNKVIVEWYNTVKAADPFPNRYINDYGILNQDTKHQQAYFDLIKELTESGAPIQGIGMQGHLHGAIAPETLLKTLDKFAVFDLPIQITEYDFISDFPEDEVKYNRDFLTAMFSHPSVNAVMVWGFWKPAKQNWRSDFYFFDDDFNEHPVAAMWKDMTQNVWYTSVTDQTNKKGSMSANAFKGKYEIKIENDDAVRLLACRLTDSGNNFQIDENLILGAGDVTEKSSDVTTENELIRLKDGSFSFEVNIEDAGTYQLGMNASVNGDVKEWYTVNFDVKIDDNETTIFVDADKSDFKAGIANTSLSLTEGKHTLTIKWNKYAEANDADAIATIKDVFLIKEIK